MKEEELAPLPIIPYNEEIDLVAAPPTSQPFFEKKKQVAPKPETPERYTATVPQLAPLTLPPKANFVEESMAIANEMSAALPTQIEDNMNEKHLEQE